MQDLLDFDDIQVDDEEGFDDVSGHGKEGVLYFKLITTPLVCPALNMCCVPALNMYCVYLHSTCTVCACTQRVLCLPALNMCCVPCTQHVLC